MRRFPMAGKRIITQDLNIYIICFVSYIGYEFDEIDSCDTCKIDSDVTVINPVMVLVPYLLEKDGAAPVL